MGSKELDTSPSENPFLAPTLKYSDAWEKLLDTRREYCDEVLTSLCEETRKLVDNEEHPWANNLDDLRYRWQHFIEVAGVLALQYSNPILRDEEDRIRTNQSRFIEQSINLVLATIQSEGWETPGIGIELKSRSNDPLAQKVDLRDMYEPEVILGDMALDEFKQLSEEQLKDIEQRLRVLVFDTDFIGNAGLSTAIPQAATSRQEWRKFWELTRLKKYGVPDREIDNDELFEYIQAYVDAIRRHNPEYGKVPVNFEEFSDDTKQNIAFLFEYFDGMRECNEYIGIDAYSLYSTMGLEEKDVEDLVSNGILKHEGSTLSPIGELDCYELSRDYYECWLARHFPPQVQ